MVLAIGLLLDVGSRFVSYDVIAFRAWEAMTRRGNTGLGGIFEPDKRYENGHAYGDLASMSNRPFMRQYHQEVFTTDDYGFRNSPKPTRNPVAVSCGTSYTAGSTLNDDETLPAQLSKLLRGDVYNAGEMNVSNRTRLDDLLRRISVAPGGTLIDEYLERVTPFLPEDIHDERSLERRMKQMLGNRYRPVRLAFSDLHGWLLTSPLQVALTLGRKAIEDDVLLPNSFEDGALFETLTNGDPILFLPRDLQPDPRKELDSVVAYWRLQAAYLATFHLRLLVVLVPSQYTVYAPLTANPPSRLEGVDYLARLESKLRLGSIDCINLTGPLQTAAREGLPRHRYVFWRDDTHWNAAGVAVAARAIAEHLATRSTATQ